MPFLWAIAAGSLAAALEFAFHNKLNWWHNLWWLAPAAVVINFFVSQLLRTDFGWLPSMVLFGVVTASWRIGLAFGVSHEPLTAPNIVSALVMLAGVGIKLFWR